MSEGGGGYLSQRVVLIGVLSTLVYIFSSRDILHGGNCPYRVITSGEGALGVVLL